MACCERPQAEGIDEEDVELILARLADEDAARTASTVEVLENPPAPRSNFSLTQVPGGDLILFGGEFFDGETNTCFNHLFRYSPDKQEWRQFTSPTQPNHRCAHQAVVIRDHLYVFGGEFATAEQFYHYNDLWRFHLIDNRWERLEMRKGPSARSGHRMVAWKHYLVLFGGFYEAVRDNRWFDDLWLFDTREMCWIQPTIPDTLLAPSARSGFGMVTLAGAKDQILLYGGYSEVSVPGAAGKRGKTHTDLWLLHMAPFMSGGPPRWERVRCVGSVPSPRASFSMTVYKERVLLFGGVTDTEAGRDELVSEFHNDLYAFDPGRRRWYALEMKDEKTKKSRRTKRSKGSRASAGGAGGERATPMVGDSESEDESDDEDEDDDRDVQDILDAIVDENAFYYWEDGKLVRMELSDDEGDDAGADGSGDGTAAEEATAAAAAQPAPPAPAAEPVADTAATAETAAASAAAAEAPPLPEATGGADTPAAAEEPTEEDAPPAKPAPVGRTKPGLWVVGNTLFLYGGLREGREREVTMDDMWQLDLVRRVEWVQILAGTVAAWRGEESDAEEDDEDGEGGDDEDDDEAAELSPEARAAIEAEQTATRDRIRVLRRTLDVGDAGKTPLASEKMRDFFARTVSSWVDVAASELAEGERLQGKQLRRRAFGYARRRYDELWPVLEELNELEAEQTRLETEFGAGRSLSEVHAMRDAARGGAGGDPGKKGKKKRKGKAGKS